MHIVGTMWSVDLCIKYVSLNISKAFCLTGMMMHTYEPWYVISVCVYSIHWWNQFPYPRFSILHHTAYHHVLIPGLQLLGFYLWQPQILLLSAWDGDQAPQAPTPASPSQEPPVCPYSIPRTIAVIHFLLFPQRQLKSTLIIEIRRKPWN